MIRGTTRRSVVGVLFAGAAALALAAVPMGAGRARTGELKIGDKAPDFTLVDTDGKEYKLSEVGKDKVVVLEWFNPGCPFVKKQYETTHTMRETYEKAKDRGVLWLAINSGAAGKQGHGKDLNAKMRKEWSIEYPILLDEEGKVGRAYGAKTTPHMFIIKADGTLAYKGAIDNNPSADKAGDVNYVTQALKEILAGETVSTPETRSYGCSVKYSTGG